MSIRRSVLVSTFAVGLAACSSVPIPPDPLAALDDAERRLGTETGAGDAHVILASVGDAPFEGTDQLARYKLLLATAQFRTGSEWRAFKTIREFAEEHRFSEWAPRVEDLEYEIGEALIRSDDGWWLFGSDREDGEIVLEHFVARYNTHEKVPEALKLLGDAAYEIESYFLARERYRQLVQDHPESEWAPLAAFRIAMAGYRGLVGPAYDLAEMTLTRNELRDYLARRPERPEFRTGAEEALATVTRWLAERHLMVATFYRTVRNAPGEIHHLVALVRSFGDSEAATTARGRLEELQVVYTDPNAAAAAADPGTPETAR